ncbi:hypothetical protein D3C73_824960 [compost metagenome]
MLITIRTIEVIISFVIEYGRIRLKNVICWRVHIFNLIFVCSLRKCPLDKKQQESNRQQIYFVH